MLENLIAGAAAGGFLLVAALAYPAGWGWATSSLPPSWGSSSDGQSRRRCSWASPSESWSASGSWPHAACQARKQAIPFAPYLALGGVVGQLFGGDLVDWYLDLSQG